MIKKITQSILIIIFFLSWMIWTKQPILAETDPRANRDTQSARDRVFAFCDPAVFPRGLRGEQLNCEPQPTAPPGSGVSPTTSPNQPTSTPPPIGGLPTTVPTQPPSGSSNNDDPCAGDKSFIGPYCGWSPRVGGQDGGGGSSAQAATVSNIKGLSYTSSSDLEPSDIIFLVGFLCLALYARSKFTVNKIQ